MLFAILLGAAIGYAFGRVPGLFIGGVIGAFLFTRLRNKVVGRLKDMQSGFVESVFAVMGAVSKADGVVTRDEIRMAEAMFDRFHLNTAQRETAKAAFNRGKAPGFDLDAELQRFRQLCAGQSALLQMFLQVQVAAVAADGSVHPAEHEMLVRIARGLGLPENLVEQLEATLRGARAGASGSANYSTGQQIEDAYKTLGVSPDVSDAELKRAYRRLMSENHPDKLAGRGLPESMREMAEERTREISHAYDVVKEARKQSA